jgi:hypothetical protein
MPNLYVFLEELLIQGGSVSNVEIGKPRMIPTLKHGLRIRTVANPEPAGPPA